jgi:hypothetical protein
MINLKQMKQEKYTFKGKTFLCDSWTIGQLNFALSLNNHKERYKKYKTK